MLLFYWLIAIMPLDQHPIWGRQLIGTFTVIKLLGILCFLIALARMPFEHRKRTLLSSRAARWYVTFFVFQCLSMMIHAPDMVIRATAVSHVLSVFFLFIVVITLVDSEKKLQWSLLVGVGSIAFCSMYAIRQWQKYGRMASDFRPGGMLGDANEYALIAGLWMPLAFLWAVNREHPRWQRLFSAGCLALMLAGTTLAASRGSFLGLIAASLVLVWQMHSRLQNLLMLAAVIIPLALFAPGSALNRMRNPGYADNLGETARILAWKGGVRMVKAHPIAGVGLHNFKPLVAQYQDPDERVVSLAHNTYLEIAAEMGVIALGVFIATGISVLRLTAHVRRTMIHAGRDDLAGIALGLQAGLTSFLVNAFFVTVWWNKIFWLAAFLVMVLHAIARRELARQPADLDEPAMVSAA